MSGPRALFVIPPVEGGAFRSTDELCHGLAKLGWDITLVHQEDGRPYRQYLHRRLTNLVYKLGRPTTLVQLLSRFGSHLDTSDASDLRCFSASVAENGAIALMGRKRFDVVVASSMLRPTWVRLREAAAVNSTPIVFYIRGQTMLEHLRLAAPPELVVVNSHALAAEVERRGLEAAVVYSVIDLTPYEVSTTRETALVVNPIPQYGVDLAIEVARLAPHIPFEFRESHSMSRDERQALLMRLKDLSNVELLPPTASPSELYGRARVLLVPYPATDLATNRPRVVIEAQRSGIPSIGSKIPGLVEAIGDAGETVSHQDPAKWVDRLSSLFSSTHYYDRLCQAGRIQTDDPNLQPSQLVSLFAEHVTNAIGPTAGSLSDRGQCR